MLRDIPSLPDPREWAKIVATVLVSQGKTIAQVEGSTGADDIGSIRHEQRVLEEMRKLGAS